MNWTTGDPVSKLQQISKYLKKKKNQLKFKSKLISLESLKIRKAEMEKPRDKVERVSLSAAWASPLGTAGL